MENKTSKYFKYAIGEIILVVIGILIALQINNWNEANKYHKVEIQLLKQVKIDLESNNKEIESVIDKLESSNQAIDSVLSALKKPEFRANTSLYYSIIHSKQFLNSINSGYKRIQNSPSVAINNDSILNKIIELYEIDFDNALTFEKQMHGFIENALFSYTNKNFEILSGYQMSFSGIDDNQKNFFQPLDLENLSNDNTFKNILFQLKQTSENRLKHCEMVKIKVTDLITAIDSEINSK